MVDIAGGVTAKLPSLASRERSVQATLRAGADTLTCEASWWRLRMWRCRSSRSQASRSAISCGRAALAGVGSILVLSHACATWQRRGQRRLCIHGAHPSCKSGTSVVMLAKGSDAAVDVQMNSMSSRTALPDDSIQHPPWAARAVDREKSGLDMQLRFERDGFVVCRDMLSRPEVSLLGDELERVRRTDECTLDALRHQVRVQEGAEAAAACQDVRECRRRLRPLEERGEVSFLQYFNLHRASSALRQLAMSPRLALWATRLLGVPRVRLYQDALFLKRPGDGPTQWHSDLGLAPFDTNSFVTAWLALTPIPAQNGSGLCFAKGSHRDFALPYHGDPEEDLSGRYEVEEFGGLKPGDATFHHGWTLHSANGIDPDSRSPRLAWAVSFVADGARLLRLRPGCNVDEQEDAVSFESWIKDAKGGEVVDHPLVPLVPAVV